jgi:SulP family sulfate permease
MAALLGVLVFDTLPGLFIGIGVSLLLLLYRASRPHVARLGRVPGGGQYGDLARHPENEAPDGVAVRREAGADAALLETHPSVGEAVAAARRAAPSRITLGG